MLRKRLTFAASSHARYSPAKYSVLLGSLPPSQLPLMVSSSPQRKQSWCQTMRPYRDTPWDRPSLTIHSDFGIALCRRYAYALSLARLQILCLATVNDGPASAGTPSGPRRLKVVEHRPDNPMEKKMTVCAKVLTLIPFDFHMVIAWTLCKSRPHDWLTPSISILFARETQQHLTKFYIYRCARSELRQKHAKACGWLESLL
jgi:hypothetical protein